MYHHSIEPMLVCWRKCCPARCFHCQFSSPECCSSSIHIQSRNRHHQVVVKFLTHDFARSVCRWMITVRVFNFHFHIHTRRFDNMHVHTIPIDLIEFFIFLLTDHVSFNHVTISLHDTLLVVTVTVGTGTVFVCHWKPAAPI